MCLLHGLMAELSVKTNTVKVLLCDLVNNSLTPTGGENNRILNLLQYIYIYIARKKIVKSMWCTTRKPKGSLYTRSLTKLFKRISYRSINNVKQCYSFTLYFSLKVIV